MQELLGDVLAKLEASPTNGETPTRYVIRVGPQEVADWPTMRHFLNAVQLPDVVEGGQRRREARMRAENTIFQYCGEWQVVECFGEYLPDAGIAVQAHAFFIETVDLRDLPALVIAAKQDHPLRIADFEQEGKSHCSNRAPSTVHIVAEEEVVCVRRRATYVKHLFHILELAMDVAHNGHGTLYLDAVWLFLQQFMGCLTQSLALCFSEVPFLQYVLNLCIKVVLDACPPWLHGHCWRVAAEGHKAFNPVVELE
eukprot:CAMPEP_0179114870 /NCGR_PEP_ID=MMETSP0796-20121207/53807_1 /TAXON_ID=73915 /ORGANISM="Pyrodinium bahamense, Strain pbaha01" /LENGTH=253 /DNA_ID=CAMNT_0020813103 /DNA_START=363 /DNA_END=1121 /DNA_ORIENTATION=+